MFYDWQAAGGAGRERGAILMARAAFVRALRWWKLK
jgi:hypothetical protein